MTQTVAVPTDPVARVEAERKQRLADATAAAIASTSSVTVAGYVTDKDQGKKEDGTLFKYTAVVSMEGVTSADVQKGFADYLNRRCDNYLRNNETARQEARASKMLIVNAVDLISGTKVDEVDIMIRAGKSDAEIGEYFAKRAAALRAKK